MTASIGMIFRVLAAVSLLVVLVLSAVFDHNLGLVLKPTCSGKIKKSASSHTPSTNETITQQQNEITSLLVSHNNNHSSLPVPLLTHPQWCPNAKCHNTALCKPCKRRFLILISSGRSASTTLTWMLDSLPGITMSGENNNALGRIRQMQDGIIHNSNMQQANNKNNNQYATTPLGPWSHHKFVDQSFSCVSQDMIRFINPPILNSQGEPIDPEMEAKEIVGFKTVRFFHKMQQPSEEEDMAKWLVENFPCSRVILNINSDVEGGAKSLLKAWGKKNGKSLADQRRVIEKSMEQSKRLYKLLGPKRSYLLDKAEWTSGNMTYLNDAVQWLGYHKSCKFQELLEYNTIGVYGAGKTKLKPWPKTCQPL